MNSKILKLAKLIMHFAELETDKGILTINSDLVNGAEVYIQRDGEYFPAEDGEYAWSDKKIIIKDGKVEEILEIENIQEEIEEIIEDAMAKKECMEDVPEQEAVAEPEKDEKDLRIEELEGLLKDRDAVIEELNAKLKELEDKVAQPVEEPIKMNKVIADKGADNKALRYFSK